MATPAHAQPHRSRTRFIVVSWLLAMAGLTYLDRVCIATLAPDIMDDLGLSRMQMSWAFSAFTIAYAAFEVPTAWWADRIGSRRVLARIVGWWSAFTIATAGVFNWHSLLAIRFLFGVGEAGAWPNAARVFSRWIPKAERGTVQGIFFAAAHLAGGLTPLLVMALRDVLHWRAIFVVFGAVGFIWVFGWYVWFRDEPREHPRVSSAEADLIEAGRQTGTGHHLSLGQAFGLIRSRQVAALCLMYVANTYGFYFLITWLPSYLSKGRGLSGTELSVFSGLPLLLSVFADLAGGVTTDRLAARYGLRAGRRIVGAAGYGIAAVLLAISVGVAHAQIAAFLLATAAAFSMFTLAPSWAACIEMGGPAAASLAALMNTAGQIGGILSPLVLAYLVDTYGDWNLPILVLVGLYVVATICWTIIDATHVVYPPAQ